MHLLYDASATQRPTGMSRVVSHTAVRSLPSENRFAVHEGGAHSVANNVWGFVRESENVSQEGFDALVHFRRLSEKPRPQERASSTFLGILIIKTTKNF